MQAKKKLLDVTSLAIAALCLTVSTTQASSTITRINVNGKFATVFLVDAGTHTFGSLTASKDQIANTSALDFSYGYPDPGNPTDQIILISGAGAIHIIRVFPDTKQFHRSAADNAPLASWKRKFFDCFKVHHLAFLLVCQSL